MPFDKRSGRYLQHLGQWIESFIIEPASIEVWVKSRICVWSQAFQSFSLGCLFRNLLHSIMLSKVSSRKLLGSESPRTHPNSVEILLRYVGVQNCGSFTSSSLTHGAWDIRSYLKWNRSKVRMVCPSNGGTYPAIRLLTLSSTVAPEFDTSEGSTRWIAIELLIGLSSPQKKFTTSKGQAIRCFAQRLLSRYNHLDSCSKSILYSSMLKMSQYVVTDDWQPYAG